MSSASGLRACGTIQRNMHHSYFAEDHLFALIKDPSIEPIIREVGLTEAALIAAVDKIRGNRRVCITSFERAFHVLPKYAIDLTALARDGKFDPVIGRDREIGQLINILCRRKKKNPVLVGEPGVGKSTVVQGLAELIVKHKVPDSLFGPLFSLDMGALMAETNVKGECKERLDSLLDEIKKASKEGVVVTLFINQLHLIVAGSDPSNWGMDAANLLKPMLADGTLRCIGATTPTGYHKFIGQDTDLGRQFTQISIDEPSVPETINILRGVREKYEVHHGVQISDDALISAATLAHRYLRSRHLPDSAIDLVDEASASVRVTREAASEAINKLQRRKLELEEEIRVLRCEDRPSRRRISTIRIAIAGIEHQLQSLLVAREIERNDSDEIDRIRKKIPMLEGKLGDARKRNDAHVVSDLLEHALPDLRNRLKGLEEKQATKDVIGGGSDTVAPEHIAEIVARWTSIPVTRFMLSEKEELLYLEKVLEETVVGQPEAVKVVANVIRLSKSGLRSTARPVASFIMAGPSGTGKILLSKTLATVLYDSPDAMIRIDSSEYSERHSVSRLIGAPPGYAGHNDLGGQLTEYVRHKPYCVVLIDEVEKACREIIDLFQQIMDFGRLEDGQCRAVDFRNVVIIMTSDLGAIHLSNMAEGPVKSHTRDLVVRAIRGHFPPEFVSQIDEVVPFRTLSFNGVKRIVDIKLSKVRDHLAGKRLTLRIDKEAMDFLCATGYSLTNGVRPLNYVIQSGLLNPLSALILSDQVHDGQTLRVAFDGTRLVIMPIAPSERSPERDRTRTKSAGRLHLQR